MLKIRLKLIVHLNAWPEKGGGAIRDDGKEGAAGDGQQASGAQIALHHRCSSCWQPGEAHIQFSFAEIYGRLTTKDSTIQYEEDCSEPGSKKTHPLHLRLLTPLGASLLRKRR